METLAVVAVVVVAFAAVARLVLRALTGKHGCPPGCRCEGQRAGKDCGPDSG